MKRSEMIELITKRLNSIGVSDDTCSEILDIIEKAGMLPPGVEQNFTTRDDPTNPAVMYEWELEDE